MELPVVAGNVGVLAGVVALVLLVWIVTFRTLFRYAWKGPTADALYRRCRWPARATVAVLTMLLGLPILELGETSFGVTAHVLQLVLIATFSWLVVRAAYVAEDATAGRFDLSVEDNLLARRRATQAQVFRRVVVAVVAVLAVAGMLLTFEGFRTFGASLLASAGVAGIIAGVAARSTLGNVVAGIQIAFSEPIRLDDVVVVEGEWGHIEEITLTYVVVRIWDKRRLVLPTSYFVENPFQNWTRHGAAVLGAVTLDVDYRLPVDALREELERVVEASDLWDGDTWVLQVVDATERTMQLRALVTARNAPTSWDLRCEVREALIAFLQREYPWALPRLRIELSGEREAELPTAWDGEHAPRDGIRHHT